MKSKYIEPKGGRAIKLRSLTENEQIILLMGHLGFDYVRIGYVGSDESEWQKDNKELCDELGMNYVGEYFISIKDKKYYYLPYKDISQVIDFKNDWNWIMKLAKKFRYLKITTNNNKAYEQLFKTVINLGIKGVK